MSRWGNSFHYGNLSHIGSGWWGLSGSLLDWSAWWQPYDWQWRCGWFWHFRPEKSGTPQDDLLFGSWWSDRIRAGAGDDIVIGWSGDDKVFGGTGNDLIFGNNGNDRLFGQEGNDWIFGGNGRDRILGGRGDDHLFGGRSNDLIWGNEGSDEIDGGSGFDTLRLKGDTNEYGVFSDGAGGLEILHFETGDLDRVVNVERIRFDDEALNTSRIQTWQTGDGAGVFRGRKNGTDIVSLSFDPDLLPSTDIEIAATTNGIEIRSGSKITPLTFIRIDDLHIAFRDEQQGIDLTISGDFEGVLSPNTTYISGTSADDTINVIRSVNQSFVIRGLAGNDKIFGGNGNDTIFGGEGDDEIWAGPFFATGVDFVSGDAGDDHLHLTGGKVSAFGGLGNDQFGFYSGASGSTAYGGAGSDFFGRDFDNIIESPIFGGKAYPNPTGITAYGNAGQDIFDLFYSEAGNRDGYLVADFNYDEDFLVGRTDPQITNEGFSFTLNQDNTTRVVHYFDLDNVFFQNVITLKGDFSDANAHKDTRLFQGKTIDVFALNRDPRGSDDFVSTHEDAVENLTSKVLANDIDPDKSDSKLIIVSAGSINDFRSGISELGAEVNVVNGELFYDATQSEVLNALNVGDTAKDKFSYEISDGRGGTSFGIVEVTVHGRSDAPAAKANSAVINEDSTWIVAANLVAGDPDSADQGKLVFTALDTMSLGTKGSVKPGAVGGTFVYDPGIAFNYLSAGETAQDAFIVTFTDPAGNSVDVTLNVTISGLNDTPTANNDTATVFADQDVSVNVVQNDSDPDRNDTLTVDRLFVPGNQNARVILSGDRKSVLYDPDGSFDYLGAGETATDTLRYKVTDGGNSDESDQYADLTITVRGVNDGPEAADDVLQDGVLQNGKLVFDFPGQVLVNDSDPDQNQTPDFTWISAIDGASFSSSFYGLPITLASGAILTVDQNGRATFDTNGAFKSFAKGQTGTTSFTYAINDGFATDTATVEIKVTGENDAPDAIDDRFFLKADTPFLGSVFAANGAGPDIDPDQGDTFTVTAINGGLSPVGQSFQLQSGATLILGANGTFSYDPTGSLLLEALDDTDAPVFDSFTYQITDSSGAIDSALVVIETSGVNDAPIAQDDQGTTERNTVLNVNAANGLLINDGDPDTADLGKLFITSVEGRGLIAPAGQTPSTTFTLVTGSKITVFADGSFSFDPNGVYNGLPKGSSTKEVVNYTVSDGDATDTARLEITITVPPDQPPQFDFNTSVFALELTEDANVNQWGELKGVHSIRVFDADGGLNIGGDPVFVKTTHPDQIQLGQSADGGPLIRVIGNGVEGITAIQYTVDNSAVQFLGAGENLIETYDYSVKDVDGVPVTAQLTYTINGMNDRPIAGTDTFSARADGGLVILDLLANDSDADRNDTLTLTEIAGTAISAGTAQSILVAGGTVEVSVFGDIAFVPNAGSSGLVDFGYKVSDGTVEVQGRVTGTVLPPSTETTPVATNIAISVFEDGPGMTFAFPATDADLGDVLTFELRATPLNGTTTNNNDGTFTFNPNGAYEDLDTFSFTRDGIGFVAVDGMGNVSNEGHISVTISGQDETAPGDTSVAQIAGVAAPELFLLPATAQTVEIFNFSPLQDTIEASGIGIDSVAEVRNLLGTARNTDFGLEMIAPGLDLNSEADDVILAFFGLSASDVSADWFAV